MKIESPGRLLTIGEFAAATQLSLKALRLYDDQGLLRPATIDAANGYRYYRHDQIATGRLIRLLRDMDLTLAAVADVISSPTSETEIVLRRHAQDLEQRFARQRRAFRTALSHLHKISAVATTFVEKRSRQTDAVAVRPFLADRHSLLPRFRAEDAAARAALDQAGIAPFGNAACLLLDPLSDEEGQLEWFASLPDRRALPSGMTVRQRPACDYAAIVVEFAAAEPVDLTAGIDTLFDWFDRRGHRVLEPPAVTFETRTSGIKAEISWAYE